MLTKRIIPCLDIKNNRTVKGVHFLNLKDAGDPIDLAKLYVQQGADELVFLDITASNERRKTLINLVQKIAQEINIPFTVGGGISSVEDVRNLLKAGADKVSINTAALNRPHLIKEIADQFGNQCVVVAIDVKKIDGNYFVFKNGGRINTQVKLESWLHTVETLGAGEILLTSMNQDGTKDGFDIALMQLAGTCVNLPLIASGGAGKASHFGEVFKKTKTSGALAASIFHFGEVPIPVLKQILKQKNLPIR
jgi:cyclase